MAKRKRLKDVVIDDVLYLVHENGEIEEVVVDGIYKVSSTRYAIQIKDGEYFFNKDYLTAFKEILVEDRYNNCYVFLNRLDAREKEIEIFNEKGKRLKEKLFEAQNKVAEHLEKRFEMETEFINEKLN